MKLPEILSRYPRLSLAVYASLLPAFAEHLAPLGFIEPFVLQFAGPPSCGKSRAVQLARSVWGHPHSGPRTAGNNIHVWDSMSALKDSRVSHDIEKWFEGRSTAVLVMDGALPDPLSSWDETHPANGRMITLWGSPFGRIGVQGALDSDALGMAMHGYSGTLGPYIVEMVKRAPDEAKARWKALYIETRAAYAEKAAPYGAIQARLSAHLAGLAVSAQLAQALKPEFFTWDWAPSIKDAWTWLCLSRDRSNGATFALEMVRDYAGRNAHRLAVVGNPGAVPPVSGFIGVQDPEANILYLTRRWLEETFTEEGLDLQATVKEWMETGAAFRPSEDSRASWTVAVPGQGKVRCVALPLDPNPTSRRVPS